MLKHQIFSKILSGFVGNPRVALLMSGKGSNAVNILKNRNLYPNIDFRVILTDNPKSNAEDIARIFCLKYILVEGLVSSKELRSEFFERITKELLGEDIEYVIYAGFMKIATKEFVTQFPGLNMHPSDLTLVNTKGVPIFRGMNAVEDSVRSGYDYVASTLYVVDDSVDAGFVLAVSRYVTVKEDDKINTKVLHERLKIQGEHPLFCLMLQKLAKGEVRESDLPIKG